MTTIKSIAFAAIIGLAVTACNNAANENKETETTSQDSTATTAVTAKDFSGNYVTEDYAKRSEGYDWVGVTVTNAGADSVIISVRSRADKKKPTCTFDAVAQKRNDSTYAAIAQEKTVLFTFSDSKIAIKTESPDDAAVLNYFCSGGGTLAGEYNKINEPLDAAQMDKSAAK